MTQGDGDLPGAHGRRERAVLRRGLGRGHGRRDRRGARARRAARSKPDGRRHAVRRQAPPPVARLYARPRAGGAVPRRAHGRRRPAAAGPVLGPLPVARRRRHDDPRLEPRDGRGRPLRRAAVRAGRQGDRPGTGAAAPGRGRHGRPRGRVPPVRRRRRRPRHERPAAARARAPGHRARSGATTRRSRLLFVAPILITGPRDVHPARGRDARRPPSRSSTSLGGPLATVLGDALDRRRSRPTAITVSAADDETAARAAVEAAAR